jgi:transcription elongation GreA/GreB family factor
MKKIEIIHQIIESLSKDLAIAFNAAKTAHEASIHEENIADNEYGTLSLEASYIAQGQANRAQEIKIALDTYRNLTVKDFPEDSAIRLTALVTLEADTCPARTVFLGPDSGGLKIQISDIEIVVITPESPLGRALIGKYAGDQVMLRINNVSVEFEIKAVC